MAAVKAKDRSQKWYSTEDVPEKKVTRKAQRPTKIRKSLEPGTTLIILAGRFRGKRVVMLKQIEDTLLVTGPFKINGVPLRRVNPAYVIATSAPKVDVSSIDLSKFDKAYFAKAGRKGSQAGDAKDLEFFAERDGKKTVPESRSADQKQVDAAVIKSIDKLGGSFKSYLRASFALSNGDRPHLMKF